MEFKLCEDCNGNGYLISTLGLKYKCPVCDGIGEVEDNTCDGCGDLLEYNPVTESYGCRFCDEELTERNALFSMFQWGN